MTGDSMKRIFASIALLALGLPAYADDARIAITTASGQSAPVTMTAPVCGVDSSGSPVICGGGGSGNLAYKDAGGQYQTILPVVPVCSVTADGVPQTCSFSGGTTDLSAYLTKADAQAEYPQLAAQNNFTAEQHFAYAYFADPDNNVQRDAKFGDKGIAVGGGTKTDTLTVTGAASTGALTVTGNIAEQGIPTFTNSSGQINGQITGSTVKWYLNRNSNRTYTMLNTYTTGGWVPFMFNDDGTLSTTVGTMANLGADVEFTKTLTVDGVTSVPDTTKTDLSKSALNTESANARFVTLQTLTDNYETIAGMANYALATNGTLTTPSITQPSIDGGKLTTDGSGNIILSGINGIKFGGLEWMNYNSTYNYIAVNGNFEVTGTVNVPTRPTGDNQGYAATTSFVQNTLNAERGSVTGDLSASGSSLTITLGASGLQLVMSYSASGTGSLSAMAASGSLTPVDIYETAAWGTTSFKGFTLDSGTITTTPTVIDSTFYLTSNAWGTYHVGVGGHLYVVDIFGSGAGKRTVIAWRKES